MDKEPANMTAKTREQSAITVRLGKYNKNGKQIQTERMRKVMELFWCNPMKNFAVYILQRCDKAFKTQIKSR